MKPIVILSASLAAQVVVAEEPASTGEHAMHGARPAYSEQPASPNLQHAPDAPDQQMDHEVLLTNVTIDQLERRENDSGALEGSAWIGGDRDKLWFKTEVEREEGETEKAELQALYSRAISPYWNLQAGVRHDFELESDSRNWGIIGLNGLAPYFFESDASLFVGEDGDSALRFETEYELLLTQRWILSPKVELNFYGQNDRETGTGSGLSDAGAGLRLRYEFTPQFAPYIGVNHEKKFGNAADFARDEGESPSETTWVVGLHAWF
ncbi:copper resistance protein B [Microbulbifer halophilus]|uniref:Copper resistance protein B n=1 Tax=Microbulbifer halophilus TaxID=453963 RepID=A0ABW5EFB7_9GAMM|nr:copper resistance protein B [Microbulbifer halophilus]MCW8127691.1 copper resistance protein B [Microbulbifer halophilus]